MKAFVFPGQGSQRKGMGSELFEKHSTIVRAANDILAYDIEELCINDPQKQLSFTEFTQPAIFVVSVLSYLEKIKSETSPDFLAGHSIGEYAALFAAETFDFETGLTIVKKRAELMSKVEGGGLAAVVGLSLDEVVERIENFGISGIDIANVNSPTQIVVGGQLDTLHEFIQFSSTLSGRVIPLRVSGAFHTRQMLTAENDFRDFLENFTFETPKIPVISNTTAEFHKDSQIGDCLAKHISNPVLWTDCIGTLLRSGVNNFTEIGSTILAPMIAATREQVALAARESLVEKESNVSDSSFSSILGLKKPLVVGSTGYTKGGVDLVFTLAKGGILSFLDTADVDITRIEKSIALLASNTEVKDYFGVSIRYNDADLDLEEKIIDLCIKYSVRFIELSGYIEPTEALLRYRLAAGLDDYGRAKNKILVRVDDEDSFDCFLQKSNNSFLSTPNMGINENSHLSIVDAICIEMQAWHPKVSNTSELLMACRAKRDQFIQANDLKAEVFIGVSGITTEQKTITDTLANEADFILVGSAFLLTDEVQIEPALKKTLRTAKDNNFTNIYDWLFPECGSSSFCYTEYTDIRHQVTTLQELYLSDELSIATLKEVFTRFETEVNSFLSADFLARCEAMRISELRKYLRERIKTELHQKIMVCDASFAQLNEWLDGNDDSSSLGALQLANLLYPKNHIN